MMDLELLLFFGARVVPKGKGDVYNSDQLCTLDSQSIWDVELQGWVRKLLEEIGMLIEGKLTWIGSHCCE